MQVLMIALVETGDNFTFIATHDTFASIEAAKILNKLCAVIFEFDRLNVSAYYYTKSLYSLLSLIEELEDTPDNVEKAVEVFKKEFSKKNNRRL